MLPTKLLRGSTQGTGLLYQMIGYQLDEVSSKDSSLFVALKSTSKTADGWSFSSLKAKMLIILTQLPATPFSFKERPRGPASVIKKYLQPFTCFRCKITRGRTSPNLGNVWLRECRLE